MRSLGTALKLVAKEDTTKPTVYWGRSFQNREEVWGTSFPKSAGRSREGLGKDFKLFGARFAHYHALHQRCDWLLQNSDVCKMARAGEVEALNNAEAELAGASHSF